MDGDGLQDSNINQNASADISKSAAIKFVILLGVISLFADMTYEGARSVTGAFLAELGASATIVGFVAGFGELLGYGLRLISGYLVDRTARYWTITIIGYLLNLIAVPLLALAGNWQMASMLIIIERIGKAIRTPARDAMLAHSGQQIGSGWAFGVNEFLDQMGAMIGPLIIAAVFYLKGDYREGFAILLAPALIAISILFIARTLYPKPQNLETKLNLDAKGMNSTFWIYVISASLVAAGYADFTLMAFHFAKNAILSNTMIPISYAVAMGMSGLAALWFGRIFDRSGFSILIIVTILSSLFAPLVFWGGAYLVFIGVALWSIGLSAHESLMNAVIANMVTTNKRGSAYGVFNTAFGISWFLGSALMGILYDISITYLIIFAVATQLIAAILLYFVMKRLENE